ncbi:hypothetical protein [Streptomyces jeddahensis]|uniref:Integral membrane protein n=1 Tax=Streptomyces jeddahensis TaxID=1716141 RepID=A0A177HWD2_9ACTN|nr:hypothetical protein [Streptomyces jeddahensis]OAH14448.1 hypothetical protein STSP_21680 [Streptomyces jeddahensis]
MRTQGTEEARTQGTEDAREVVDEAGGSGSSVEVSARTEVRATQRDGRQDRRERRPDGARRRAVDPVKGLMHQHRELCERAIDPLEIAAGLEAHGVTDRTAARFRHRDVFSLAEEMYARVPRAGEPAEPPETRGTPEPRAAWVATALLPGAVCGLAVAGMHALGGNLRLVAGIFGAIAVTAALCVALRHGPLHTPGRTGTATRAWTGWLILYAVCGDGLLAAALAGGPDGPWPLATAPALGLALAVAPAAWCAYLFATKARSRLAVSRGLAELRAAVRPLLLGVFAMFLTVLAILLGLSGAVLGEDAAYAGAGALGALLLLGRLLAAHGAGHVQAAVLGAAAGAEMLALASAFAGRLPGFSVLAVPVEAAVDAGGPGLVPAAACGAAALVLLVHAVRRLACASAHATPEDAS